MIAFSFLRTATLIVVLILQMHVYFSVDVAWHCRHSDIFGSVGDDKQLLVWDTRNASTSEASMKVVDAHAAEVSDHVAPL
jgi:histone-binding protein RBBP4